MAINTVVFDAYGTLFDVSAAARHAANDPSNAAIKTTWQILANNWRLKQLQYTWLRAVAGQHCDFWQITKDGLDWALDAQNIDDPDLRERLLNLYWSLDAYSEVPEMLGKLKEMGRKTAILSNGSPDMLKAAVESAGIGPLLDDVISVEDVKIFKPAKQVYDLVETRFNVSSGQVLFVSSNGWDVAGAAHFGFETVWVNRASEPVDRLYGAPKHQIPDLTTLHELI